MQMNHECAYFEELHVFQRDCATITPSTRTRDFHKRGVSFKQQRQHCPDRASWATGIGSLCFVQQRRVAVCVCVCVSISPLPPARALSDSLVCAGQGAAESGL